MSKRNRRMERGQVTILVILALATFLLAFAGLATDYTNFWFHRQAAQGGADATCQAAAVDLYLLASGVQSPTVHFTPTVGGTVDCADPGSWNPPPGDTGTAPAPCIVAKYNGYDAMVASNHVVMSFPADVPGVTPPPGVSLAFVKADVTIDARTYFSRLLTGMRTVPVHAAAVCGLTAVPGPVPIVVLHPTDPDAVRMNGRSAAITVVKGPKQSVQVNSQNVTAVDLTTVDLSLGGPNKSGSDFGVFGGPAGQPGGVLLGTTGHWRYPSLPIVDPYRNVDAPGSQPPGVGPTPVAFDAAGNLGCPDPGGCVRYTAGSYPSGIHVGPGGHKTAIFDPGVYYLGGDGLKLASNSTLRVSMATGDGSGGVMFYFSDPAGTSSIYVASDSGHWPACTSVSPPSPNNCVVQYHIDGSSEFGVASRPMKCDPGGDLPPELFAPPINGVIAGNVFLAPCTGTYGDLSTDATQRYRGFLFFQDRAYAVGAGGGNPPPQWQGGGSTLAAGLMYFHQCRAGDHTGTGICNAFGDVFNMGGTPGSSSYAVGSLITDKILVSGTPGLTMILNPNNQDNQLRIGFFQ